MIVVASTLLIELSLRNVLWLECDCYRLKLATLQYLIRKSFDKFFVIHAILVHGNSMCKLLWFNTALVMWSPYATLSRRTYLHCPM